jgi:hypothetical protein
MPEELHPIDPVEIKLADGKPRQLRFTNATIKRIKKRLNLPSVRALFELEISDSCAALILEGLIEKDDLTEDAIDELIPFHMLPEIQAAVIAAISGKPVAEVKNELRRAEEGSSAPTPTAATSATGYVNGHSSESLDSPTTGSAPEPKPLPS